MTTDNIQEKIERNWPSRYIAFYFAQVLSGECSIEATLQDLLSLDKLEEPE